jgi:hypothetical protein
MPGAEGGGIFVSYRRQETSHVAGRLYDRLADRFGESQVFIDVDTIEPGVDFAEAIFRAVAACQVLLAIIGPGWLTAADERGARRLDDPDDIVRLEIEAALVRDVRVIPILVEGAVMPARQDLPGSLAGLARRNALLIRHESFRSDTGRLITAIERIMAPVAATVAPTGSGLVRNDLARAARLFADAERIANSIPDESRKVSVLSRVAQALAAADPDRAERIANSIPDESRKVSVLSRVAQALAAADPDRAARLFTDAERIANSITDRSSKASALSYVAEALAAADPDRAERIANSTTVDFVKTSALRQVATALTATDPDRAERIANSIPDEWWKAEVRGGVAEALAVTDLDRAVRIANSIPDKSMEAYALSRVAEALVAADPDRAVRIANSIADESWKAIALSSVGEALAATSS